MADDPNFFAGFLDDYYAEAEEHLIAAADTLLALDSKIGQASVQRAAVDDLFRFFHTLKAISAMVELRPAEQLAHHLEHYLRVVRDRETALSAAGTHVLMDGTRRLEEIINAHRAEREPPSIADIVERVETLVRPPADGGPAAPGTRPPERRWICTFAPTRELLAAGTGVDVVRKRLSEIGAIVDAVPQVLPDGTISFRFTLVTGADVDVADAVNTDPIEVEEIAPAGNGDAPTEETAPDSGAGGSSTGAPAHVVRVDLSRLDRLMQGVGDLVIGRARLVDSLHRIERYVPPVEWRAVQDNSVAFERQLRALREGIMRVRLVPVGEIFRRMPFVARDLARETGRNALLELKGQGTEIDKYLIERMMDPVLHLVRNAISHGIEEPSVRVARGKRPEGTITLSATTIGDAVVLEVADDGGGVDEAAVTAKARRLGFDVPPAPLDSAALLAILCSPGFSTKTEADRASGRGVGMAVVKQTVEELSGTLTLETSSGEGTRFIIQLPVTLAITDALIGRVGQECFAVPQAAIREVIEIESIEMRQIEQNELVPYRDTALPIVRLSTLFGIDTPPATRMHVFVVGTGAETVGLAVDRILGQREIVVRTITDPLVRVDGISGATDLGDGRVVLILDPATIARLTRQRAARVFRDVARWGQMRA